MNEPLKRHSERIRYIEHVIEAARGATSLARLEAGRTHIWNDLDQIADDKVRREAQDIFRRTMSVAAALERDTPEEVSDVVIEGLAELSAYLEANDIGSALD